MSLRVSDGTYVNTNRKFEQLDPASKAANKPA